MKYGENLPGQRAFQATELWPLLEERTLRYTMGESGSVPIELAEELFASILFCLEAGAKTAQGEKRLATLWQQGVAQLQWEIRRGRALLSAVEQTALSIENRAYHDTQKELKQFFKQYDVQFFAHQIPCMIDYQLAHPVPDTLLGIKFINEYLRRMLIENQFCQCFEQPQICELLQAACPDYKGLLINLFEPVFTNALGLILLQRDVVRLDIKDEERNALKVLLQNTPDINNYLYRGAQELCRAFDIKGKEQQAYLLQAAGALSVRIQAAMEADNDLSQLFPAFGSCSGPQEVFAFEDAVPMQDTKLQKLIGEMQSCRYMADKVIMLRREIHSLADFIEVLDTCFVWEEYKEIYSQLQPEVLAALGHSLKRRWDYVQQYPRWGQSLLQYLLQKRKGKSCNFSVSKAGKVGQIFCDEA